MKKKCHKNFELKNNYGGNDRNLHLMIRIINNSFMGASPFWLISKIIIIIGNQLSFFKFEDTITTSKIIFFPPENPPSSEN